MKKLVFGIFCYLFLASLCACGDGKSESLTKESRDTVAMTTIMISDSLCFDLNDNVKKVVWADAHITYPILFMDRENTDGLQHLFSNEVLYVNSDTLSLASAFPFYLLQLMTDVADSGFDVNQVGENTVDSECKVKVKIHPIYNDGLYLSYCKEQELISSDTKSSLKEYFVLGLNDMKKLELFDIYDLRDLAIVKTMLKDKLYNIYNVKSDDELSDLGFYKIYDIEVGENFYLTQDSVIWNYNQHELSIFGDVSVSLSRVDIERKIENTK